MITNKREAIDRAIHRLATAVLLQAVQDAGSASIGKRSAALRWIGSNEKSPFSFAFICQVLNRNPRDVRRICECRAAARRRAYLPFRDPQVIQANMSASLSSFSLS